MSEESRRPVPPDVFRKICPEIKPQKKKKRQFRQGFARLLQILLHKPLLQPPYSGPLQKIAILAQEKYGDAILLTPLLRQLRIHFSATEIHVITFSRATHDTSFLLHSLIVRAGRKAGIDSPYHRGIYDYLVQLDFHTQVAIKNCGLLAILGKSVQAEQCRPYIPIMQVSDRIKVFLDSFPERSVIGINISAGKPNRYWTEQNWVELIRTFTEERFLLLSAPKDRELKTRLEHSCTNIITSPDTNNLFEASLITEKLKALITPDTAMVHIASCTDTAVIGLFGAAEQDLSRFKPFLVDHRLVLSPTKQVADIELKSVIDALSEYLSD